MATVDTIPADLRQLLQQTDSLPMCRFSEVGQPHRRTLIHYTGEVRRRVHRRKLHIGKEPVCWQQLA